MMHPALASLYTSQAAPVVEDVFIYDVTELATDSAIEMATWTEKRGKRGGKIAVNEHGRVLYGQKALRALSISRARERRGTPGQRLNRNLVASKATGVRRSGPMEAGRLAASAITPDKPLSGKQVRTEAVKGKKQTPTRGKPKAERRKDGQPADSKITDPLRQITAQNVDGLWQRFTDEIVNHDPTMSRNAAGEIAAVRILNAYRAAGQKFRDDLDRRVRAGGDVSDAEDAIYMTVGDTTRALTDKLERLSGIRAWAAVEQDPLANRPLDAEPLEDTAAKKRTGRAELEEKASQAAAERESRLSQKRDAAASQRKTPAQKPADEKPSSTQAPKPKPASRRKEKPELPMSEALTQLHHADEVPVPRKTARNLVDSLTLKSAPQHAFARMLNETGYYTDGKVLLKLPDAEASKAREMLNSRNAGQDKSFRYPKPEDYLEKKHHAEKAQILGAVPVEYSRMKTPEYLLEDGKGRRALVQAHLVKMVTDRYPDAEMHLSGREDDGPVVFRSGGKVVAVVMPFARGPKTKFIDKFKPPGAAGEQTGA